MKEAYPAALVREDDNSGYSVYFPDIEAPSGGSTVEEALFYAGEGLWAGLEILQEQGRSFPVPSTLDETRAHVHSVRTLAELPCPDDILYVEIPVPDEFRDRFREDCRTACL
ncbi:MAG TPA: type II toxin-antitoxin system HicB family antitoxin [Candidatus Desulfovibrio intestinipullorum]|uniref:Type II toxin-antitoxin system HicB family antitoxin n=1 Tax=Candidatus Desulfovibrio intestinipullorum TaxID=2838536 RepID=A0A9D1PVE2_9BACT|nr:type II toxin-antitoxin system HicB family antitoxin [Candidatus Desulfovibrio intestinipullorum]